ncbi:MAG: hypothetical protein PHX43_05240 [Alphaproteobacteria bacterium]|nr:hypothetical protein [Alphaproteobacteria bacterium]
MKELLSEITVEQAEKVYEEKSICCTVKNGEIVAEVECEDYCEEC